MVAYDGNAPKAGHVEALAGRSFVATMRLPVIAHCNNMLMRFCRPCWAARRWLLPKLKCLQYVAGHTGVHTITDHNRRALSEVASRRKTLAWRVLMVAMRLHVAADYEDTLASSRKQCRSAS
jgi:hypothetical protein